MYYLLSGQPIVNNVVTLALPYVENKAQLDFNSLKKAYCQFLKNIQPHCPIPDAEHLFFADSETEKSFAGYFTQEEVDITSILEKIDVKNVFYPNPLERKKVLESAFLGLEKNQPMLADIFKLVMNTVFCTASENLGGTSVNPGYIGVMCAHHDMKAEPKAVAELLIHEFTHNCLFLDELRYGHFKDKGKLADSTTHIDAEAHGVKLKLPFNRIIHSLMVSVEVLSLRDAYIGHQPRAHQHLPTPQLVARSRHYINLINEKRAMYNELMTDRCQFLFDTCADFFSNYQPKEKN